MANKLPLAPNGAFQSRRPSLMFQNDINSFTSIQIASPFLVPRNISERCANERIIHSIRNIISRASGPNCSHKKPILGQHSLLCGSVNWKYKTIFHFVFPELFFLSLIFFFFCIIWFNIWYLMAESLCLTAPAFSPPVTPQNFSKPKNKVSFCNWSC